MWHDLRRLHLSLVGGVMRGVSIVVLAAITLSGCAAMPDRDRTILAGAGAGAAVGALVGSVSGGGPPARWAGAVIGGATGAVVGALIRHNACYIRNRRGEIWQIPCDTPRVTAEACFFGPSRHSLSEVPCPGKL